MWIIFVLLFAFGFCILDCISDLIEFEKFLENESEFDKSNSESKFDLSNSESEFDLSNSESEFDLSNSESEDCKKWRI